MPPHMKKRQVTVKRRGEGAVVPVGVSCTETEDAFYVRVRPTEDNKYLRVKIAKAELELTDSEKVEW